MKDFVNNVNSDEVAFVSNQLYYNIDNLTKENLKYNPNTNQYEYTPKGAIEPKVALYSTADLLNYYFGDHLEDVQNNNKIYIITTSNDIDIILYGQKVIGYGIHNNEQSFTEGVQNFIEEKIRDYAGGKAKEYLNIPDNDVTESMKASINLWKAFEAVSNESGIKPSDYAKALEDLGKLVNKFDYFYDESAMDKYISSMCMEIDRAMLMKILYGQFNDHSGELDLGEGIITGGIYEDYYRWCEEHKYDVVEYVEDCANYDATSYSKDGKTIIPNNIDMSEIAETVTDYVQKCNEPTIWDKIVKIGEDVFITAYEFGKDLGSDIVDKFHKDKPLTYNIAIPQNTKNAKKTYVTASNQRYDPLILDLDGDGFNIETKENGANFDLDKNGLAEKINWTKKDGILCLDLNGNGKVDNGGEVFGDWTMLPDGARAKNGFEALAQYDSNEDGVIDANDQIFSQLRVWVDADGDGISGNGEMKTLAELGIVSINLGYENVNAETGTEALIGNTATFTRADGTTGKAGELWVSADLFDTEDRLDVEVSDEIAALPNVKSIGNVYSLHSAIALDSFVNICSPIAYIVINNAA